MINKYNKYYIISSISNHWERDSHAFRHDSKPIAPDGQEPRYTDKISGESRPP